MQFCILVKSDDPANQVFCRLIEAYCCENRIKVVKVDCGVTLTLMTEEPTDEIHHCVLIQVFIILYVLSENTYTQYVGPMSANTLPFTSDII